MDSRIYDAKMSHQIVADIYKEVDVLDPETGEPTGEKENVVDGEATVLASDALGIGSFELTDIRDQNSYLVRRLADGNCWMGESLSLDLTTATMTEEDTNNPASAFLTEYDTENHVEWCDSEEDAACIDKVLWYKPDEGFSDTYYYNFYTASAGNGKYGSSAIDAAGDICPFGWTLPARLGGDTNSIAKLLTAYNFPTSQTSDLAIHDAFLEVPFEYRMSRYYNALGELFQARLGVSYLKTMNGTNGAYSFYLGAADKVTIGVAHSMARLLPVRCVSHGTENNVTPEEPITTCSANSICYDSNGGSGSMNPTTNATFGSSKVLSAPTYTRTGYAFVGWSESKDAVQSGTYIYGPNETITVPNLSSEGMTLYAQWLAPENSSYTMQAFGRNETVKTCATMTDGNNGTTEERIALRDERDDNVYIVTKLKDGNCWMTSNLALNLADFAGKTTGTLLTPENTDLTASREDLSTLTIEGVGGGQQTVKYWDPQESSVQKFVDLGLGTAEQYSFPTLANKLLGQEGQLHQFQSSGESRYLWGSKCTPIYDESNPPKIVNTTCDSSATVLSNILAEIPREYINPTRANFNFYAATAESGKYDIDSGNAPDSICPSGWTLPFYTNAPDDNQTLRQLLVNKYDNSVSKFYSLPLSFTESGFYYHDGKSYLGNGTRIITNAYYGNKGYAYISITNSNAILIDSTYDAKSNGEAIRCIKK